MGEGELALSLDRRAPLPPDEPLSFEGMQRLRSFPFVALKTAGPEDLADDGGILEKAFLGARQAVEARRDDALQRLRQREPFGGATFEVEVGELLGVQWVAAGSLQQRLLGLGGDDRTVEQGGEQSCCLLVRERGEREGRRIELSTAPARSALEELGPRGSDDQERHVADPLDQLVDEVEQARVRPMQVLEDEDEWP